MVKKIISRQAYDTDTATCLHYRDWRFAHVSGPSVETGILGLAFGLI
jgi:hypothetical protein